MPTYIDLLPDELCIKIYKLLYDHVAWDIEGGGGDPVYPLEMYYSFCPENSDYIRAEYLKRKYIN